MMPVRVIPVSASLYKIGAGGGPFCKRRIFPGQNQVFWSISGAVEFDGIMIDCETEGGGTLGTFQGCPAVMPNGCIVELYLGESEEWYTNLGQYIVVTPYDLYWGRPAKPAVAKPNWKKLGF